MIQNLTLLVSSTPSVAATRFLAKSGGRRAAALVSASSRSSDRGADPGLSRVGHASAAFPTIAWEKEKKMSRLLGRSNFQKQNRHNFYIILKNSVFATSRRASSSTAIFRSVLRFRDVYPGSWILDPGSRIPDLGSRILDLGSRISDPGSRIQQEQKEKLFFSYLFCSHKFHKNWRKNFFFE